MKMGKHSWWMMLGCALPIIGIVLLPLFGVKLGGAFQVLLLLACPLSMVFMMMGMGHDHSRHDEDDTDGHSHDHGERSMRNVTPHRELQQDRKEE
ncbi:MAG TPA: DUF2933 domain-containing protein [Spirochaetia bacterium]